MLVDCSCAGGATRYGYLLLPWVIEGTIGDITIENGPVNFNLKSITQEGNDWGVGPYDVIKLANGTSSPLLDPIPSTRHRHLQLTTLAPPAAVCGCQDLVIAS